MAEEQTAAPLQRLRELLDRLLVIDVFLVIAGALWFGIAVLCHSQGIEAPLNLFQRLWEPLFTPAIGLLMAAAVFSGILSWWQRQGRR
jgi:NhaP-type Na+/H+ or K+/H+ antiporter